MYRSGVRKPRYAEVAVDSLAAVAADCSRKDPLTDLLALAGYRNRNGHTYKVWPSPARTEDRNLRQLFGR